jgi:hypothetical protein
MVVFVSYGTFLIPNGTIVNLNITPRTPPYSTIRLSFGTTRCTGINYPNQQLFTPGSPSTKWWNVYNTANTNCSGQLSYPGLSFGTWYYS